MNNVYHILFQEIDVTCFLENEKFQCLFRCDYISVMLI